jgi:hypothetical protein
VKRIPNSQRSAFSTVWGQLLKQALDDKKYSSWAEFNAFPKLILSTLERGGSRLSKKAKFADVVQKRLAQWKRGEKSELWKVVVARSKQDPLATPRKAKKLDIKVLEAAVVSALRMGDVRKALQMLNSAPIAPRRPSDAYVTYTLRAPSLLRFKLMVHPTLLTTWFAQPSAPSALVRPLVYLATSPRFCNKQLELRPSTLVHSWQGA